MSEPRESLWVIEWRPNGGEWRPWAIRVREWSALKWCERQRVRYPKADYRVVEYRRVEAEEKLR